MTALPFTTEQFVDVFRRYNESVWPAQWALVALGVAAVAIAWRGGSRSGALAGIALAVLWAWAGIVYHLGFFRAVNPAATLFGALFVAQAALLAWAALSRDRLTFAARRDARGVLGILLVTYALVVYPALGALLGHRYPAAPTFGLPCPLTILTIGVLLQAGPRTPRLLLAVPLAWAAIGMSAAVQLGMREDFGLLVAGLAAAWSLVRHGDDRTLVARHASA